MQRGALRHACRASTSGRARSIGDGNRTRVVRSRDGSTSRCTTPTERSNARVEKPRCSRTPPVGAASLACRASTSERVESSQSMESNHPIRGYEPRPCTSTDCVGVIEPSGNFRAPECGSLDGLFPYEESAGPPASDPWSGSVWSRTKCLACRASTSGRAKRR